MRKFDLDDLEIIQAVASHGSVTRAAQLLHRVPSNISTRIKQTEARLGVPLFIRQGRGLKPTEEGRTLAAYANRLMRLVNEAQACISDGGVPGTLRIGALESTAGSRLPQLLSQFNRAHPSIRVELSTGTTGALIDRLYRRDIEAAFVSEPFHAPGLAMQAVFEEELVLITAKSIRTFEPAAWPQMTLIAFSSGCSYRRLLEQWRNSFGTTATSVMEFSSYPAIVACVAAGTGVAIVPRSVLDGLQAAKSVRVHTLPPDLTKNRTHLLWHSGQESNALRKLQRMLGV